MIFYNNKDNLKEQITDNIKELEKYKNSYKKKIELYNIYIDTIDGFEEENIQKKELSSQKLKDRISFFNTQINKIDNNINILNVFLKGYDIQNKTKIEASIVDNYNQKYMEIRDNFINNCFLEEDITIKYINCLVNDFAITFEKIKEEKGTNMNVENTISQNSKLKNNNTLLISEKEGKVIFPYTAKEVLEIFNNTNNKYETIEEVIEKEFTRNFSDYKVQFASRYNETMKLAREKENYGLIDSITLSTEMMKKRFLHPAIISACRNLNELDVYLDCLDKNELDEFKIFKIKYELYPMVIKQKSNKIGNHYIESQEPTILKKIKNFFNIKKVEKFNES